MTARACENWITTYAEYTKASESPDAFHFWTAVSTIAGALRRRVWIDMNIFQWTPNFYIMLVGPPGIAAKSTSISLGYRLLREVPDVHFGPQSMTWQALTMALEEAAQVVEHGEERTPHCSITCSIRELGTFLRPDDSELVDVLVALWDGQLETWSRRTKTQGNTTLANPWINVIGCTTPAWLKSNFPEVLVGGGLTSRIIFVYGDRKRQLVPLPDEVVDEPEFRRLSDALIHDLRQIADLAGRFDLLPEARAWVRDWYERWWSSPPPAHLIGDRFGGYRARKQTHLMKLAMILSVAQRSTLEITREDLELADTMITDTERSMLKVFDSIGVNERSRPTLELLQYIRAYKEIEQRQLWRIVMTGMSHDEFTHAVRSAIKAGYVHAQTEGNNVVFTATPLLLEREL